MGDLLKCVEVLRGIMKTNGAKFAVRHDPRSIVGRIVTELSGDTQAPVVDLVKRARQCKRFRLWYVHEGTLTMGGRGPDLTCVGDHAFSGCTGITSLTLPVGIKSIGESAFDDCSGITSL